MDKKERLGIVAIHDDMGVVDDYVLYMLKELKKVVENLVVVSNGNMNGQSVSKISEFAEKVFIREDMGYDAAAFRDVQMNLLGWEEIYQYQELVLVNDSVFGPLFSLEKVFTKMDKEDCDFWGITGQPEIEVSAKIYGVDTLPYHIQPYFLVVRQSLLKSEIYKVFWEELLNTNTYMEAVINYELRLTEYFTSAGFIGKTFMKPEVSPEGIGSELNYIMEEPYLCITKWDNPFIKRKCFLLGCDNYLNWSMAEDVTRILNYIEKHTLYDVKLIWKALIRKADPGVLRESLKLEYILSSKVVHNKEKLCQKGVVVAHIYYPHLISKSVGYLKNVPNELDIIITTSSLDKKAMIQEECERKEINNYEIRVVENRGREIGALLVGCHDILSKYEYLCFVHDKATSGNQGADKIGQSFMYILWDNVLKSCEYIRNVLSFLEEKEHIGVLAPPAPYHAEYFGNYGNEWTQCFERTKDLAQVLGLNCIMSEEVAPYTIGTAFWCKTKALKTLFEKEFRYEDFPKEPLALDDSINHAIERIFAYVAQHEGYATGILMNEQFASLQLSNYSYMLNGLLEKKRESTCFVRYSDLIYQQNYYDLSDLPRFVQKYERTMVYGTGFFAERITEYLQKRNICLDGYIVSDGRRREWCFKGKKVYELSEVSPDKGTGIIIAMNQKNYEKVITELFKKGFQHLYYRGEEDIQL